MLTRRRARSGNDCDFHRRPKLVSNHPVVHSFIYVGLEYGASVVVGPVNQLILTALRPPLLERDKGDSIPCIVNPHK
jgi:hypothetical protein